MRLKVVTKKDQAVLSIDDESIVEQLLDKLVQEGIVQNEDEFNIKAGFPPKNLDLVGGNKLLDLGVRAGDKLIIEEIKKGSDDVVEEPAPAKKQKIELTPKSIEKGAKSVPFGDGSVDLHTIPDNNSCLFESLKYLTKTSVDLREIVAQYIMADPINYNDAILGKPVEEYVQWITKKTSWGGAIELQILSSFLNVTVNSIDVETGRVDSFNPDASKYIVVLYTGIHYDAVVFKEHGKETTIFDKTSKLGSDFIGGAKSLAKGLNHKGYVTNTNTFKVKCKTCGSVLDGEKGVTEHASKAGHFDFGEVS